MRDEQDFFQPFKKRKRQAPLPASSCCSLPELLKSNLAAYFPQCSKGDQTNHLFRNLCLQRILQLRIDRSYHSRCFKLLIIPHPSARIIHNVTFQFAVSKVCARLLNHIKNYVYDAARNLYWFEIQFVIENDTFSSNVIV